MTDHKAFFEKLADNRIALVDKFGIDYGGCYCTVEELYQAFKSRYEEESLREFQKAYAVSAVDLISQIVTPEEGGHE